MNDQIKNLFMRDAIKHGNMWLYPKKVTLQILKYCQDHEIKLHGIEGFWLYDWGGIEPSQENSCWLKNAEPKDFMEFLINAEEDCCFELFYDGY